MGVVERAFTVVDTEDLLEYPFDENTRLDSHHFMAWEHGRWLNSSMRAKGTAECRALYFDLICISMEQTPVGTLPDDLDELAFHLRVDSAHFKALCRMDYGPLHKWQSCQTKGGARRLYHPHVLLMVTDAISRKHDNQAKNDAANKAKRLQRLRTTLASYNASLAEQDGAVLWIEDWLSERCSGYRTSAWIEQALGAWSAHSMQLNRTRSAF
ncbi:hypothetical protein ABEB22_15235 (plasmid) [Thioclava sp. 'Guangxiensis']|uniref:hypothetical protein n=1 Tax=Thioclava sp. 'Guangxiensis' TaxID=3149044 RepID=UPI0032C419B2